MDCKRALEETNGDVDAAAKLLREKGIAQAAKRAGRETTEGKVAHRLATRRSAAMVAVGCETEPVSNNEEFLVFVERVLDAVEKDGAAGGRASSRTSASSCPRSSARTSSSAARSGSRRGRARSSPATCTRRRTRSACSSTARGDAELAPAAGDAHLASPRRSTGRGRRCPRRRSTREREILREVARGRVEAGAGAEKIVEGMLNKRFFDRRPRPTRSGSTTSGKTVGQALQEAGSEVIEFRRFALAE